MNTYLPTGAGPCAKRTVTAVVVLPNGNRYASTNFCMKPQLSCPRDEAGYEAGEGYHICQEVCQQPAHAEVNAIRWAMRKEPWHDTGPHLKNPLKGSDIYVDHTWVCDNCALTAHGHSVKVHLGKPPVPVSHTQRQWYGFEASRKAILGAA